LPNYEAEIPFIDGKLPINLNIMGKAGPSQQKNKRHKALL
jgi:hypothetical protein